MLHYLQHASCKVDTNPQYGGRHGSKDGRKEVGGDLRESGEKSRQEGWVHCKAFRVESLGGDSFAPRVGGQRAIRL